MGASPYPRFRATAFEAWPDRVKANAFAAPMLSLEVGRTADGGFDFDPDDVPAALGTDAFPKLGIKSWQETGRLRRIPADVPLAPSIAARLRSPTRQQIVSAPAWTNDQVPLQLHLFPWEDMSETSEGRVLAPTRGGGRMLSRCLRGASAGLLSEGAAQAIKFARGMAELFDLGSLVVQVSVRPDGRLGVIDVNPALTFHELAWLDRRAG